MKRIVITGASGDLARRVVRILEARGAAERLILVSRSPERVEVPGADVRYGDFDAPETLEAAFSGGDTLLLISGLAINRRVQQHRNAIEAARRAGIRQIVYTSTAGIHPRNPTLSAQEHIVTEQDLRESGMISTILRNATYADVVATLMLAPALESGRWEHAAAGGYLAPVAKQDIAECAACCVLEPDRHAGAVYEISGPELLTFADMAAIASKVHGRHIEFVPITAAEAYAQFDAMGVPRSYQDGMKLEETDAWPSDEMVSASVSMARNFHALASRHVEFITGRPATSMEAVMQAAKGKTYAELQL